MTRVEIYDRRTGDNVWGLWVLDLDAWVRHWNENCSVTLYEYRVKAAPDLPADPGECDPLSDGCNDGLGAFSARTNQRFLFGN